MMWFKYPLIILLIFIFALLQNSFLQYFSIMGATPNFVFIIFFILIFFEIQKRSNAGFFIAIVAGLLLDMFLPIYFGVSIITLLIIYFLEKELMHFLKDNKDQYPIKYFLFSFVLFLLMYSVFLYFFSTFLSFPFYFGWNVLVSVGYSIIFAWAGFHIYKKLAKNEGTSNQLKLFK